MAEMLFEILSEEMPARFIDSACTRWRTLAEKTFSDAQLTYKEVHTFATPRRLTLHIEGLPTTLPAEHRLVKGPRTDAPAQALTGFLKKISTESNTPLSQEDLKQESTPKGVFWTAEITTPEKRVHDLLPEVCLKLLKAFTWPATMTWGAESFLWVRPIRRLLLLFHGHPLEMTLPLGHTNLTSDNTTEGHRVLGPGPWVVSSFTDYVQKLKENGVVLCTEARREKILVDATDLLKAKNLQLKESDVTSNGLIEEVKNLVEYPFVFLGEIDAACMALPTEVIATTLHQHQRCFPVYNSTGKIQPFFISVANGTPKDRGTQTKNGWERVIRARLRDALFLYEQDLATPLETFAAHLKERLFFKDLGTMADKTARLKALASLVSDDTALEKAATYAKVDLSSAMVDEFPALQGIMGAHYGERAGLSPEICHAIRTHDQAATTHTPENTLGIQLGIIDRLDNLYGFFSLGLKPTGSKDPLALKRMGNDVLTLLNLQPEIDTCALMGALPNMHGHDTHKATETQKSLWAFFGERLAFFYKTHQFTPGLSAFLKNARHADWALGAHIHYAMHMQVQLNGKDRDKLITLAKNLGRLVPFLESTQPDTHQDAQVLQHNAEKALFAQVQKLKNLITEISTSASLTQKAQKIWPSLLELGPALDSFFEAVMVNTEDIKLKKQRILLLHDIQQLTSPFGEWPCLWHDVKHVD